MVSVLASSRMVYRVLGPDNAVRLAISEGWYLTNRWIFTVLADINNIPWVDMSLHTDTLS
jgi:hypothetical protein